MFLEEECQHTLLSLLNEDTFIDNAAFFTDITCHLNALNPNIQERQNILPMIFNDVSAFGTKLDLFAQQLKENDLTYFPVLHDYRHPPPTAHTSLNLKSSFLSDSQTFTDKITKPVVAFMENLFNCDIFSTAVSVSDLQLGAKGAVFEERLIELQHNTFLKGRHKEQSANTFWISSVLKDTYPALIQCAQKILTCFGSTYACESSFSASAIIKSKHRSHLTD